jgi:acyl carrier protein
VAYAPHLTEIQALVLEAFDNELDPQGVALALETRLHDLGIDSLTLAEVIVFLQQRLGVQLDIDEDLTAAAHTTVADFAKAVTQHVGRV